MSRQPDAADPAGDHAGARDRWRHGRDRRRHPDPELGRTSQVPLLGDIPVLGNLFKRRSVSTQTPGTDLLHHSEDRADVVGNQHLTRSPRQFGGELAVGFSLLAPNLTIMFMDYTAWTRDGRRLAVQAMRSSRSMRCWSRISPTSATCAGSPAAPECSRRFHGRRSSSPTDATPRRRARKCRRARGDCQGTAAAGGGESRARRSKVRASASKRST